MKVRNAEVVERRKCMDAVHSTTKTNKKYETREAITLLFSLLDEGINDMESDRLISEEDMWAELDTI